jgi:hypothetical protein
VQKSRFTKSIRLSKVRRTVKPKTGVKIMRNDHAFRSPANGAYPTPEVIERAMARAHRMRAEAVHEYLRRAWEAVAGVVRRTPTARTPAAQCC